jgi:hypothetical protein
VRMNFEVGALPRCFESGKGAIFEFLSIFVKGWDMYGVELSHNIHMSQYFKEKFQAIP